MIRRVWYVGGMILGLAVTSCSGDDEPTDANVTGSDGAPDEDGADEDGADSDAADDADAVDSDGASDDDAAGEASDLEDPEETVSSPARPPGESTMGAEPLSPDLGMTPASVGSECESDDDCGDGAICLVDDSSFHDGRFAGGLCTFRCEQDPYSCGSSAICATNEQGNLDPSDDVGYCFEACAYTGAPSKCSGSRNRACVLLDPSGIGWCEPKCHSDAECGDGYCQQGPPFTCVDEEEVGSPDGTVCESNADCLGGVCTYVAQADTTGVCMSYCALQIDTVACGREDGDTSPAASVCLSPLPLLIYYNIQIQPGDFGECLPACDLEQGCAHPGWACLDMESDEFSSDTGRDGICVPRWLLDEADSGTDVPIETDVSSEQTDAMSDEQADDAMSDEQADDAATDPVDATDLDATDEQQETPTDETPMDDMGVGGSEN